MNKKRTVKIMIRRQDVPAYLSGSKLFALEVQLSLYGKGLNDRIITRFKNGRMLEETVTQKINTSHVCLAACHEMGDVIQ